MRNGTIVVMEVLNENVRLPIDMVLPPGIYKGMITASCHKEGAALVNHLHTAVLILDVDALKQLGIDTDDVGTSELRLPVLSHIERGDITYAID